MRRQLRGLRPGYAVVLEPAVGYKVLAGRMPGNATGGDDRKSSVEKRPYHFQPLPSLLRRRRSHPGHDLDLNQDRPRPEQAGGVWQKSGNACGPRPPFCLHAPSILSSDRVLVKILSLGVVHFFLSVLVTTAPAQPVWLSIDDAPRSGASGGRNRNHESYNCCRAESMLNDTLPRPAVKWSRAVRTGPRPRPPCRFGYVRRRARRRLPATARHRLVHEALAEHRF